MPTRITGQGVGSGPCLAYDTLDQPHVVYVRGSSKTWEFWYAWKEGPNWIQEMLETVNLNYVWRTEFAIDWLNRLHIVYTAGDNAYDLYYRGPGGVGVWETKMVLTAPRLRVTGSPLTGVARFILPGSKGQWLLFMMRPAPHPNRRDYEWRWNLGVQVYSCWCLLCTIAGKLRLV